MSNRIIIGDKVKVIEPLKTHCTHTEWAEEHNLDKFVSEHKYLPLKGEILIVIAIGPHIDIATGTLYGCEMSNGRHIIIENHGIKKISPNREIKAGDSLLAIRSLSIKSKDSKFTCSISKHHLLDITNSDDDTTSFGNSNICAETFCLYNALANGALKFFDDSSPKTQVSVQANPQCNLCKHFSFLGGTCKEKKTGPSTECFVQA